MDSKIAESAILYQGLFLGDDSTVAEFVILGAVPRGQRPGDVQTIIGPRAVIRSHSVIYAGNVIGADFQTGHGVLVREFNRIGDRVSIGSHTIIEHHVELGNDVRIHSNAFVPEYSILEDGTWVGPNAVFTNARYPHSSGAKDNLRGPRLLLGAKIGANCTLLPGVVIGYGALVGAGSIVVQDVPDGKVVVGNPARIIGDVRDLAAYQVEPQGTEEEEV